VPARPKVGSVMKWIKVFITQSSLYLFYITVLTAHTFFSTGWDMKVGREVVREVCCKVSHQPNHFWSCISDPTLEVREF
jgi:hypothetical protein